MPLIAAELLRHTGITLLKTQRRILASPLLPLPVEQDNGKTTSSWSEGFGNHSARLLIVSDAVFGKRLGSVRQVLCVCLRGSRVSDRCGAIWNQSQSGLCQALPAMPGFFVDVWATLSTATSSANEEGAENGLLPPILNCGRHHPQVEGIVMTEGWRSATVESSAASNPPSNRDGTL